MTFVVDGITYTAEEVVSWEAVLNPSDLYLVKNKTIYRLTEKKQVKKYFSKSQI
jgi:hypothetical protein